MFQLFRTPKFDFMGRRGLGYAVSSLLLAGAVAAIGMRWSSTGNPLNYGIDFRGGSLAQIRFSEPPAVEELRSKLDAAGFGNAVIQQFKPPEDDTILVRVPENLEDSNNLVSRMRHALSTPEQQAGFDAGKVDLNSVGETELASFLQTAVSGQLEKTTAPEYAAAARAIVEHRKAEDKGRYPDMSALEELEGVTFPMREALKEGAFVGSMVFQRTESVGPSVGADLRNKALFASIVANGLILLYLSVRFELRFGVAAVLTLVHDVLIILGIFALTGREFELPVLASILTVIGYSVNDTIVVFDRIRQNLKVMRRESLSEVINASINQCLGRTIMTSGSTLLVVAPLFLFGGAVLNNFAFALLLGIAIGTYSSMFVASPILLLWQRLIVRKV